MAVAVPIAFPLWLKVTVDPDPSDAGVIDPETVNPVAVAVKTATVARPPLTVTLCDAGLKLVPDLVGVTA